MKNNIYHCPECGSEGKIGSLFIEHKLSDETLICIDCTSTYNKEQMPSMLEEDNVPFNEKYAEQIAFAIVLGTVIAALALITFYII